MTEIYNETTLYTAPEYTLHISTERTPSKPRLRTCKFEMVGVIGRMHGYESYPLLDNMAEMSKAEHWFFKLLRQQLTPETCISVIVNKNLTRPEVVKKTAAVKELTKRNLIRRTKREHYMINPAALVYRPTFEINMAKWNELEREGK